MTPGGVILAVAGSLGVSGATNIGTTGVGVFKQVTGSNLELKKISAASNKITVTDDIANDEVDIDVIESNINHLNLSNVGTNTHDQIDAHIVDTSNPHSVTAVQAGADPVGTAAAQVTAHEAAADPHPQYTTPAEASAAAPIQSLNGETGVLTDYVKTDVANSFTAAQSFLEPTAPAHAATMNYVDDRAILLPALASPGAMWMLRENAAGTGFEYWRNFVQIDEKTTGSINQQDGVYETHLSITYDIPVAGDYLFSFWYIYSMNNTTLNFECHAEVDGTDIYPLHIEPKDSAGAGMVLPIVAGGTEGPATTNSGTDQFLNNAGAFLINFSAGSHTVLIEYSGRGGINLEAAIYLSLIHI